MTKPFVDPPLYIQHNCTKVEYIGQHGIAELYRVEEVE